MSTLVLLMQNGSSLVMTSMYFYLALYVLPILSSLIFQHLINIILQNAADKELKNLLLEHIRAAKRRLLTNQLPPSSSVIFM